MASPSGKRRKREVSEPFQEVSVFSCLHLCIHMCALIPLRVHFQEEYPPSSYDSVPPTHPPFSSLARATKGDDMYDEGDEEEPYVLSQTDNPTPAPGNRSTQLRSESPGFYPLLSFPSNPTNIMRRSLFFQQASGSKRTFRSKKRQSTTESMAKSYLMVIRLPP